MNYDSLSFPSVVCFRPLPVAYVAMPCTLTPPFPLDA